MASPSCTRVPGTDFAAQSFLADYLSGVTEQWLKIAPLANPGMLEMFRDRDRQPYRDMVPWANEFAGKYLTGAVQVHRLTGDRELKGFLETFVGELVSLQDEDGYLGPWPQDYRLMGQAPNAGHGGVTWDAWGHYHILLGLLMWHEDTGDASALTCAARIGDLLCHKFLGADRSPRLVDTGSTEMNLAPVHGLCLLYNRTKTQRYLDLALQIVDEFAATDAEGKPVAGDYLRQARDGKEFFQTPKPRWESLHPILALAELYYITGDETYRRAFEQLWWSIVKLDRHNNGGFSSDEQAMGNPYHRGAIETCCTIAWMAMSVEFLRLTGNSVAADELELSTLNSAVGLFSQTGRWATYNTPMDGVRKASAHEIAFQAREGTPELNCCSVNAPRGLGMISDWALMQDGEGLILNWYGPGTMTTRLPNGASVALRQETDYPRSGAVRLSVIPSTPVDFTLKVRIPYWSERTTVRLNDSEVPGVLPGRYLALRRTWAHGDTVQIALDFSPHFWVGERECEGAVSLYRGPMLLTYDRRFNAMDPDDVPVLDARGLAGRIVSWPGWLPPIQLVEFDAVDGRPLRLCDFASAGEGGSPYRSWLPVQNAETAAFSASNPLRTSRVR